jgi:hypothetical protein
MRSVPKADLTLRPEAQGCVTEQQARQFGRGVGNFTSWPSHPDGVNAVVSPIWNYLRGKRNNELHKPVIDVIEDIRASFMPPCDHATVGGQPAAGK